MNRDLIYLLYIIIFVISNANAQLVDDILENIYQQTLVQEARLDSLMNYSHVQKVHFIKMDGDGEIEDQSKRAYLVKVRSANDRQRELIKALDFEDDVWTDVTEKESTKEPKERQSAKFSLTEMVSPQTRQAYRFSLIGEESVNSIQTFKVRANPLEEDEEKFSGELWFAKDSYNLVKAILSPSENPTGVESMVMTFLMQNHGDVWLPEMVAFEAEVSFLFIFKGQIHTEIRFEEYKFDQVFEEAL